MKCKIAVSLKAPIASCYQGCAGIERVDDLYKLLSLPAGTVKYNGITKGSKARKVVIDIRAWYTTNDDGDLESAPREFLSENWPVSSLRTIAPGNPSTPRRRDLT